ncbi:MAG: hypothetical protein AAGK04_13815 [Planctomycetota bacterium]
MRSIRHAVVAALSLGAALCTLSACGEGASSTADSDDGSETASSEQAAGGNAGESAQRGDHAALDAFGAEMVEALKDGDTDKLLSHVEGVGLPEGWQAMITPMFAGMQGRELSSAVRPVSEFSREDLQWPEGDLPEALGSVEHILDVSYENTEANGDSESGRFTFPLKQVDGEWRVLLIGPDA